MEESVINDVEVTFISVNDWFLFLLLCDDHPHIFEVYIIQLLIGEDIVIVEVWGKLH